MRITLAALLLSVTFVPAGRAFGHGFELSLTSTDGIPTSIAAYAEYPGNYMDSSAINVAPGNLFYSAFNASSITGSLGTYYDVIHGGAVTQGTWPAYSASYNIISPLYFSDGVGTLANNTGPALAEPASEGTFMTVFDRYAGDPLYVGASAGTATLSGTSSFVPGYGISLLDAHELQKNLYIAPNSAQTYGEYGFAYDVTVHLAGGQTLTTGPLLNVFAPSDPNIGDFSDNAPTIQQDEATLAIFNAAIKTPATWNASASGSFNDYTKWTTSAVPNGPGQTVVINAAVASPVTVTLDTAETLGLLTLGNSANNLVGYTLATGNGGVLYVNNLDTSGQVFVTSGSHEISASVVLASSLVVTSTAGSSLNISGNVSQAAAGMSLTVDGSGVVALSGMNTFDGGTTAVGGTLALEGALSLLAGSRLVIGGGDSDSSGDFTAAPKPSAVTDVPEPPTARSIVVLIACGIAAASRKTATRLIGESRKP